MTEIIAPHILIYLLCGVAALLILFPIFKWLIWKLFSFDSKVATILHHKKSSEVRLGQISEKLAPLLADFPVDVNKPGTSTIFIGQPVDFVHMDPEEGITFIEVKTGNSKLSATQKRLKELVESGAVDWVEYRIK